MMFRFKNNLIVVLLPLLVFSVTNATPTFSSLGIVDCIQTTGKDSHIPITVGVTCNIEADSSHLSEAAAEFLKPPQTLTSSPTVTVGARSLPAVPGALLMGLTGFLCVSLVKDRRFWLAAFTGLLWAGQTGIQALPHLALHFRNRSRIERQFDSEFTCQYNLENSRLRSDVEGTQYIGLLHHLAGIPDTTIPPFSQNSGRTKDEFRAPQFAIWGLSSNLMLANKCLAAKVEHIILFSPAFIFDNLARGPPKLT
jgi:hypothetical protein